ncbi:heterokaryon incompatibility protein-domain-containing protein [Echria macrotheca]|uniref:Heterokaryon incompatibility protein-domain-containing protein n=1 Tax=Echria macrotheca TaxID=438768 RepID=A0AAJ0F9Y2_9PEZI|nr:heterokaryon incompatibility protein-domain-containing protein [Echria macrotheca]
MLSRWGGSLYQPLSPKLLETRLLELEPSAETSSDIRCRLTKRSLLPSPITEPSHPAAFEVLSYTWGDVSNDKQILVNHHTLSVTSNLEAFLRIRRERDKSVMLWIDALCINQRDTHEKNFQIPLMPLIYATARRLTVWLGPEHDNSCLAMKELASLGSTSPYEKMPILARETKQALDALLTRPWWTRVWIIQELALGGAGIKLERIQVRCGNDTIAWGSIVVAAARMQAYHNDLRQPFPNTANILELDSLRESALRFLRLSPGSPRSQGALELVCRYRHFLATDPRDKIYALTSLCARLGPDQIVPRYEARVEDIYTSFACDILAGGRDDALELLRHAGPSRYAELPSWVPDWSTPLRCQPLSLRRMQRYFEVPWWSEPTEEKPHVWRDDGTLEPSHVSYRHFPASSMQDASSPQRADELREASLRRLEIGAAGYGVVRSIDELPPNFLAHGVSHEIKTRIEEVLRTGDTLLCVSDRLQASESGASVSGVRLDAVKIGEILVERRVKRWLLRELRNGDEGAPYRAAGDSRLHARVDNNTGRSKTLEARGILCDTIDVCFETFVEDVETDWRDTTRFMVQVGKCKAEAMSHDAAAARYPEVSQRIKAFWNTLLVGQTSGPDEFGLDENKSHHPYEHWLPLIPSSWQHSTPPMVPITTGLVEMEEGFKAVQRAQEKIRSEPGGAWVDHKEDYSRDARAAARSWLQQPYDLYHRPFRFQNMIPDPYWEARQRGGDELLRQSTRTAQANDAGKPLGIGEAQKQQLLQTHQNLIRETPSMVPRCALPAGMEKYALGRSFFVTKAGRFGLGPRDTKAGDAVAVMSGSGVPFVLRERIDGEADSQTWRLVGECYVGGVMAGEMMGEEEVKMGRILLC